MHKQQLHLLLLLPERPESDRAGEPGEEAGTETENFHKIF